MANSKNGTSKQIKVSAETHAILAESAKRTGKSIKQIVDDIINTMVGK